MSSEKVRTLASRKFVKDVSNDEDCDFGTYCGQSHGLFVLKYTGPD